MSAHLQCPTEDFVESGGRCGSAHDRDDEVAVPLALQRSRARTIQVVLLLLVVVISIAVFGKALSFHFLTWDDDINITGNPHLGPLNSERLQWMFTDYSYVRRYMPFGWLSWCTLHGLAGPSSFAFHAANLFFHIVNAALIFVFLRQLPGLKDRPEDAPSTRIVRSGCVAAGTLFWALHPMRVEIVAWASGLIYAQALCGLLIAWLCFLNAQKHQGGWKKWSLQITSFATYCVSLLTYPIGLGGVAVFVALALLPFLQLARNGWEFRAGWWQTSLRQTAPYIMATALVLGLTLFSSAKASHEWGAPTTLAEFGLLSRAMQMFYILGLYVWKPWLPVNLCAVDTTLVDFEPLSFRFLLSALFVVATTILLLKNWRRVPFLLALWFCYLVLLLPVSGPTIHPHFPSDRYGYIVALMWSALLAGLLQRAWPHRRSWRLPAIMTTLAILFCCAFLTSRYLEVWRNSGSFFSYNASQIHHPKYRMAAFHRLGTWHGTRQEWPQAQLAFQEGLRLTPRNVSLNTDYGVALGATGQHEAAERQFERVLEINPHHVAAHQYLGVLAKERGDRKKYELHRDAANRLRADPAATSTGK
jgi:protein O-mannosyl-transferase